MKDSVAEHSSGKISVLHREVPTNPPGNASTSLGTNWEWALFFLLHFLKYQYNTLLAWISGAPQASKASPFLHVEGPFLQLGPEGWLNCTRAYGSAKTNCDYLCVTPVLSLCCVAGPERAGTVRDVDQHRHAAELRRRADLQVERA